VEYDLLHLHMFIEKKRKELIELGNNRKSFTDPDVVKASQKLDALLDDYQELQYKLKCKATWHKWFESDKCDVPYLIIDDMVAN